MFGCAHFFEDGIETTRGNGKNENPHPKAGAMLRFVQQYKKS